jgi:glycine cleavage system H protein
MTIAPRAGVLRLAGARFASSGPQTLNASSLPATYGDGKPTLRFTEDHEWIAIHSDKHAFVGITKYAADALGDATYIELPEVGAEIEPKESIGSVESVKSASDLYSPVGGEIVEVNEQLADKPGLINQDPMGDGWFAKIKITDEGELESLMDEARYEEFIQE